MDDIIETTTTTTTRRRKIPKPRVRLVKRVRTVTVRTAIKGARVVAKKPVRRAANVVDVKPVRVVTTSTVRELPAPAVTYALPNAETVSAKRRRLLRD